jgi:hypothetical protein
MRAMLREFVRRRLPVIPVLLPGAGLRPQLPVFLQDFTWVDMRSGIEGEPLDRLMWGITGKKQSDPQGSPVARTQPLSPSVEAASILVQPAHMPPYSGHTSRVVPPVLTPRKDGTKSAAKLRMSRLLPLAGAAFVLLPVLATIIFMFAGHGPPQAKQPAVREDHGALRQKPLTPRDRPNLPQVALQAGTILEYRRGDTFTLRILVRDAYFIESVKLFARPESETRIMRELAMKKSGLGTYEGEIPPIFHQNGTVEFYVVATDVLGGEGFLGTQDRPLRITRMAGFGRLLQ